MSTAPHGGLGAERIHVGFWTDWTHGRVFGLTLTLKEEHATYFTNFLALFINIVVIAMYIVHQTRSTSKPRPASYHQGQAVLRNTGTPFMTLWSSLGIWWTWTRSLGLNSRERVFLVISFSAAVFMATFAAASIFSSRIVRLGLEGEVLLRSENCGWLANNHTDIEREIRWGSHWRQVFRSSAILARSCWLEPDESADWPPDCKQFTVPKIDLHAEVGVPCPFPEASMCRNGTDGTMRFWTDKIDSHEHLGLNAPVEERVQYMQEVVCSPLNDSLPYFNPIEQNHTMISYGERLNHSYTWKVASDLLDFGGPVPPYHIQATKRFADMSYTGYRPIKELDVDGAELQLFLVANSVFYNTPSNDIVFGSTRPPSASTWCGAQGSFYAQPLLAIGCTVQHIMCNPVKESCTNLYSNTTDLDVTQQATGYLIMRATEFSSLGNILSLAGATSMIAQDYLQQDVGLCSLSLPDNQTAIELQNWIRMSLASLQATFRNRPWNTDGAGLVDGSEDSVGGDDSLKKLCYQQKARDEGYAAINVLAAGLILGVGILTLAVNTCLAACVGGLQRYYRMGIDRQREWHSQELLQIQCTAFEARNVGVWKGRENMVPVTYDREGLVECIHEPTTTRDSESVDGIR
ncbi:hypothetical protein P152DRAFT_515333 [Eremomyces bilateralis CBS 781.70]|uniref:Uncharacterized protein n=1 Tax=Eremomyces bilateralis CBS 781.70 TaxID=1392243 RepID=A0A6G1G0D3_9PEZI|nr:uncharacterized protein P152DRAFT_515333 [Eremomyces bilateralis CBS 781.70]KAF1811386.1 hypothetical protein P152DRAFT_515333 [Eremomyces bilateralis CBS 781.70]